MSTPPLDPSIPPVYGALLERLALALSLESVHRTLTRAFDLDAQLHSEHDESILRVLLCVRLAPEGAIRAKDISEQLLKSTSHTSRLIDRAEADGLVERRADPSDRRAYQVVLTTQGEAAIDAYVPHAVAMLDEAFAGVLTPEELQTLLGLAARVEAAALGLVARQDESRRS